MLDQEIADKQQKANHENGNAILSGLAHLAGKGKYAQLKAENTEMKRQVALLPTMVAQEVEQRMAPVLAQRDEERQHAD